MREGEFRNSPRMRGKMRNAESEIRKLEIGHAKDAKVGEGGTQGFRD